MQFYKYVRRRNKTVDKMINYIITLIIRKELNKIDASSEAMFYNILCNKYNKGQEFDSLNDH